MRVIIAGHGAGGKDHLKKKMIQQGFRREVSYTTREPRDGEVNGVDYHFVNRDIFNRLIELDEFVQYAEFKGELYGTHRKEFEKGGVFIMTPTGINKLSEEDRKSSLVIFVDIPSSIRFNRLTERQGVTPLDAKERLAEDLREFNGFNNYDVHITNPFF